MKNEFHMSVVFVVASNFGKNIPVLQLFQNWNCLIRKQSMAIWVNEKGFSLVVNNNASVEEKVGVFNAKEKPAKASSDKSEMTLEFYSVNQFSVVSRAKTPFLFRSNVFTKMEIKSKAI